MIFRVVLILACALLLSACSKQEGYAAPEAAPAALAAPQRAAAQASRDYHQPYLTEEKIAKFIASMEEEKNPLEFVFSAGAQAGNLSDMKDRLDEYNAFAKKYGFADYEDYIAVWGRITLAQTLTAAEGMKAGAIDMVTKSIASAEQELQKQNLNPELRKMFEEQVTSGKKSLADMQKPEKAPLNAADIELVRANQAGIDEAAKKHKKP